MSFLRGVKIQFLVKPMGSSNVLFSVAYAPIHLHTPFINYKGAQDIVKLHITHFLSPREDEEEIEKSLQHQMLPTEQQVLMMTMITMLYFYRLNHWFTFLVLPYK